MSLYLNPFDLSEEKDDDDMSVTPPPPSDHGDGHEEQEGLSTRQAPMVKGPRYPPSSLEGLFLLLLQPEVVDQVQQWIHHVRPW